MQHSPVCRPRTRVRRSWSRRRPRAPIIWIATSLTLTAFVGCDDVDESASQSAQRQAAELSRRLEAERQQHAHELTIAETRRAQAEEDTSAVNTILTSFGIALVVLILLLARERRARRILERLVRLLLDRLNGAQKPPRQSS